MKADYVQHWGEDLIVANAARVSLDNRSELGEDGKVTTKDAKLINYLAEHKHTSCFEHMGATLKLKVPIFIARQIQRHRVFSYNECSRRYVDSPPEFFWPASWRGRPTNVKQGSSDEVVVGIKGASYTVDDGAKAVASHALCAYQDMLDSGVAPELARMILPQNMYTDFYMSGNLRAWSHFLSLRLEAHAQLEAQEIAQQCADILTPLFPISMKALLETN